MNIDIRHYSSVTELRKMLTTVKNEVAAINRVFNGLDLIRSTVEITSSTSSNTKSKAVERLKSKANKEHQLIKITSSMGTLRACYDAVMHAHIQLTNEFPQSEHIVVKAKVVVEDTLCTLTEAMESGFCKSTAAIILPDNYSTILTNTIKEVGKLTNIKPIVSTLYSGNDQYTSYLNIGKVSDKNGFTFDQFLIVVSFDQESKITVLNRFYEPGSFTIGIDSPGNLEPLLKSFNMS